MAKSRSSKKGQDSRDQSVDQVSLGKGKARHEAISNSEDAAELLSLKKQLKEKSTLLNICGKKLRNLLTQVDKLKKGIEDSKVQVSNMAKKTAFAKNDKFIKLFTKCMEKMVAKKVAQHKVSDIVPEPLEADTMTPEKLIQEKGPKYSFEDLIAYVERMEKEENKQLSSELMLHNLNCNWNKPSGMRLNQDEDALPVTGTDEKVPAGPERIYNSKSARNEFHQRGPVSAKGSRKPTKTVRSKSKGNLADRVTRKSRSKDARLGKRATTPFRNLQEELKDLTTKGGKKLKTAGKTEADSERFLTNLTFDTPKDLVYSFTDKKSARKGKQENKSARANTPERRGKK